jgi:hypothetical protein
MSSQDHQVDANPAKRKPYESPRLVEWGSLIDLTRGGLLAPKDFPKPGGTAHT